MKQGDKFLKIVMFLLAAAVLIYFGHGAVRYFSSPLTTITALEYEADAGVTVTGYVVRDETVLTGDAPLIVPTRAEGERVGNGQTVAVAYPGTDARQQESRISDLQEQIRQLTFATDASLSIRSLNGDIAALLTDHAVRNTLQTGGAADLATELKGLIIRSGTDEEGLRHLQDEREALQRQLGSLTAQSDSGARALTAAEPGYFSGTTDGYEAALTPDSLAAMTLADYDGLEDAAKPVSDSAYGRLIRSDRWYYVTSAEEDRLGELETGDRISLTFARDAYGKMEMQVERIDRGEDGRVLLVLSCGSHMPQVTLLRRQVCKLTFQSYRGLRVPKAAVHVDKEGQAGVFVLEGAVARWKPIELLYETSDNYVARLDLSSTNHLWPGDEIILGNNLHDGKVVYQ